mgnify:FL=1
MLSPEQLRYAETHEWSVLEDDIATIGISDFAVEQLTDLVFIELPEVGQQVTRSTPFGEIESVKAVSDLYSPVDGEILEINQTLVDDLSLLSSDPYGNGWLVKIRIASGTSLDHLLDFKAYKEQIAKEDH